MFMRSQILRYLLHIIAWRSFTMRWRTCQWDKETNGVLTSRFLSSADFHLFQHLESKTELPPISRRHFLRHFLNENVWTLLPISLKFVPKVRIDDIPALFQIMAWRRPGDKPLSVPMMISLLTHICVSRPQWVKQYTWMMWFTWLYSHNVLIIISEGQVLILLGAMTFSTGMITSAGRHLIEWPNMISWE